MPCDNCKKACSAILGRLETYKEKEGINSLLANKPLFFFKLRPNAMGL